MIDLPTLLLQNGFELRKHGNEYSLKCFAHDDKNPSMSVFHGKANKWVAHCHACGWHGDNIDTYKFLSGNDSHKAAIEALQMGEVLTGNGRAKGKIIDGDPVITARTERTMIVPTIDAPLPDLPKWINSLKTRDNLPLGSPVKLWTFRTPEGLPWYYEARYHTTDENGEIMKEPRVFTYGKRGEEPAKWSCAHYPNPRPLYGLDRIAATTGQILVGEGPNKAEALQSLFPTLAATGWTGGAKAWSRSDWTSLVGRTIILWPDVDEPGRTAMAEIAQHLLTLGCTCYILSTDDLPESWDAADAVKEGWTTDKALTFAKERKGDPITHDPKAEAVADDSEPPQDDLPPVSVYEQPNQKPGYEPPPEGVPLQDWPKIIDILKDRGAPQYIKGTLPPVLENYVLDRADSIGCDINAMAIPALTCAAALIDDRITLTINDGFVVAPRLWCVTIGESSTRKSAGFDHALLPAKRIAAKIEPLNETAKAENSIIDKRMAKAWKEYEARRIDGDDQAPKPAPIQRHELHRIMVDSASIEAVQEILKDINRGVLVYKDELMEWFSFGQYKSGGAGDRAQWLSAWDGGPKHVDRIARGSFLIQNFSASVLGGIQPSKIAAQTDLSDDGLLQRFLTINIGPPHHIGADRNPDRSTTDAWFAVCDHLYDTRQNETVRLSHDANQSFRAYRQRIESLINLDAFGGSFNSVLGKHAGICGRVALVMHCINQASARRHPTSDLLPLETMDMAIRLMESYVLPHCAHFFNASGMSETHTMAKHICRILMSDDKIIADGIFSPTDIHRRIFKWQKLPEQGRANVLEILERSGWIKPVGTQDYGKRTHGKYLISPQCESLRAIHAETSRAAIDAARSIVEGIGQQ